MERNLYYMIIILILTAIIVSMLDGLQNTKPREDLCLAPSDCVNLAHDECKGSWSCTDNECSWTCDDLPGDAECTSDEDCIITGCSSQVCSNEPVFSSCEWKTEYKCLEFSSCGCINNKCAWEKTLDYLNCMDSIGDSEQTNTADDEYISS